MTKKPWGQELLLHQGFGYAVKEITLLFGHSTSLHYHEIKHECIYVISGVIRIKLSIEPSSFTFENIDICAGEFLAIQPKFIHQMSSFETNSLYLESQTDHLDDVVRLADSYGR